VKLVSPQELLGWLIWRCRVMHVNCGILKNWDIRKGLLRFEMFQILSVPSPTQNNLIVTNFLPSETLPKWVAILRINTIEKGEGNHLMPALSVNLRVCAYLLYAVYHSRMLSLQEHFCCRPVFLSRPT